MKNKLIGLSLIGMMSTMFLFADGNESTKKVTILTDAEKKEILASSKVELPSAGSLANHLQKNLGDIAWSKFMNLKTEDISKFSEERKALHLGAKGADAYFLAIAQDSAHLNGVSKNINNTLNKMILDKKPLSKRVGKKNLQALENEIKAKKWAKVLDKITKLKSKISRELLSAKQNDLKVLNDVGGWIEGYRLAVEGLKSNYKAVSTDVLLQNELINYLLSELKGLKSSHEKATLVTALGQVKKVVSKGTKNHQLAKAEVLELSKVLSTLQSIL